MRKFCFLISIFSLFFFSCGSSKVVKSNLNKVYVTNTNKVDILPVYALTSEIDDYYLFEGKIGDKTFNATLYIQADSSGIDVLILNDFGVEMGSISYDGINATMNCNLFPKKLKPEYILLDLQNAFIDSAKLKEHYKNYKLDFEELFGCAKTLDGGYNFFDRFISKKGENIETIRRTPSQITITNHLRGYEYKLTKAED